MFLAGFVLCLGRRSRAFPCLCFHAVPKTFAGWAHTGQSRTLTEQVTKLQAEVAAQTSKALAQAADMAKVKQQLQQAQGQQQNLQAELQATREKLDAAVKVLLTCICVRVLVCACVRA